MNKQRLIELAEHIESLPRGEFDMSFYLYEAKCGTVACIAGHATLLYADEWKKSKFINGHTESAFTEAMKALELCSGEAFALFAPDTPSASCSATPVARNFVSRERAAKQLRHLAETGEVNWMATP